MMTKKEANRLKRSIRKELKFYSYKDGYEVIQIADVIRAIAIVIDKEVTQCKINTEK